MSFLQSFGNSSRGSSRAKTPRCGGKRRGAWGPRPRRLWFEPLESRTVLSLLGALAAEFESPGLEAAEAGGGEQSATLSAA